MSEAFAMLLYITLIVAAVVLKASGILEMPWLIALSPLWAPIAGAIVLSIANGIIYGSKKNSQ